MIWVFLGAFGGLAAVGVAAWARASHRRVEAEKYERRDKARLDIDEARLLAKLKSQARDGED